MNRSPNSSPKRAGGAIERRRLFARLVWGALWRRRERLVIALASVAIGLSVASALILVSRDVERMVARELKSFGPNVAVVPRAEEARAGVRDVDLGTVSSRSTFLASSGALPSAGEVRASAVVPLLYGTARAVPEPMRWETVVVAGSDLAALRTVYAGWRWRESASDGAAGGRTPLWLGTDAARALGASAGDTLRLDALVAGGAAVRGTVTALFESGGAEDGLVYLPIEDAERLLDAPRQRSVLLVRAEGVPAKIEEALANGWLSGADREARPLRRMSGAEREILGRLRTLLGAVTLVALATAALCTMSTLADLVIERRREVALLKALGAARRDVLALFLAEATLLGLAGAVAGFALGAVMAQIVGWSVFQSAIRLDWTPLPILLVLGLAVTWVSSLAPLRVAAAVAPATALRGD